MESAAPAVIPQTTLTVQQKTSTVIRDSIRTKIFDLQVPIE